MTDIKDITKEEPKNVGGRPKEWTEERISETADKLLKWADKANSFALIQFCANNRFVPSKMGDLARENEGFREALMLTKAKLANRIIVSINSKDGNVHPVFFNKYIRANDYLLDLHLKDIEKAETAEITKRVVKIIDFASLKKERDDKLNDMLDAKNDPKQ